MTVKKEIKVKKSLLTLILKSTVLSILTLFIIQHFGNIRGGDLFAYPKSYIFENPINSAEYSCYWSDGYPPSNYGKSSMNNSNNGSLSGLSSANSPTSQDRSKHMPYMMKLKEFYLPSLFGNIIHIVIGVVLFAGIFAFFGNFKLKLS